MFHGIALLLATLAAQSLPMPFLFPEDLEDADHVRIEAQCPARYQTLIPPDSANPKLWYSPVAAAEKEDRIWIWYQRVNKAEKEYSDQRTLCLGELTAEGWRLPSLRPNPPAWGGPDNVVLRRSPVPPTWGGFNVFQIMRGKDQYRLLYWDQPDQGPAGAMLAASPDGLTWTKDPRGTVFTEYNDAFSVLSVMEKLLLYQTALEDWPDKPYPDNLDKKRRILTLRESNDLAQWTEQQPLLKPDAEDAPETEFYLMKAFPYGSGYAGLIMKYFADPAKPKQHSAILKTELILSHDARRWSRPFRQTDLGFWTYAEPFTHDKHYDFAVWRENSLQLAEYPLLGLTAAVAETRGVFLTPEFLYPGTGLEIHADTTNGWLEAELLDAAKQPVPDTAPCRMQAATAYSAAVPWKLKPGTPSRVRFHLDQARVFALSACAPNHHGETN